MDVEIRNPTGYDAQVLIRAYSPAAAILAGAKWELSGDELHVHLAANGKAALLQIDDVPLIIVTSGSPARILVAVNGLFRSQARISF